MHELDVKEKAMCLIVRLKKLDDLKDELIDLYSMVAELEDDISNLTLQIETEAPIVNIESFTQETDYYKLIYKNKKLKIKKKEQK